MNAGSSPTRPARRAQPGDLFCLLEPGPPAAGPIAALWRPTALVILNRSASRWTSAASMLSMLAR